MSNKKSFSPKVPLRLLSWFCPNELYEEIEGDLIYKFNKDVKAVGEKRAKWRLVWNVVRFFRPGILLRNSFYLNQIFMLMLRNNLLMAFRHIRKDKTFSAINIFGLTISMAACLLIFHYSYFELTYDQHHKDAERIYRVATTLYEGDQVRYSSAQCSPKLTPVLKEQFTEVEESGRLLPTNWFDCMLSYPGHGERKIFNENKLYYADQGYLSLFHPTLLQGDASKALIKPFSAVLSVTTAQKYFGKENAIGKVLHLKGSGDENDYTVTGVMNDPALNSHIDAEILLSENSIKSDFGFQTAYTYLKTQPGISRHQVEEKFPPLVKTLIPPGSNIKAKLFLQQIADIHMNSTLQDEMKPSGNVRSVYFLILVAGAVLLIAWVNYINLTTARAVSRAKEVGIRKVTGATLTQIAFQFLTETMVFNFIGLAGAILLVIFLAPSFYAFIGLSLPPDVLLWKLNTNLIFVFSAFILCILLIGFFPARILSSFNPVKTIKGKLIPSASGISFRRVAVIFQFSCAIILIVSVMVFNRQFNFMQQQDIGVDIKRAIVLKAPVNIDSAYRSKLTTFRNELKSLAIIRSITTSTSVPGEGIGWTGEIKKEKDESSQDFAIHVIDQDFIDSYQLHLLAGRSLKENDFPSSHFGDKLEPVLLNKRATEQLGYHQPEDAINERILWGSNTCLVVGVIDDFHQESLKKKFAPTLYTANNGPAMTIKLTEGADKNLAQSLTQLRGAWNIYFPNNPFDYYFLEDAYNKQYAGDEQLARLFHFFCLIAVILSCLGLFALSMFAVNQRMKEMTIRKILGAPIVHLIHLLTKEYFILLTLAMIVALPVAMYGAHQWLNEFAYAATLNVWIFALPVSLILLVAGFTVGGQTIRAAIQNPTKGLKHE